MAAKAELVEQVKALQRTDPDSKQAWWSYCDEYLGGVKDPNRHEARTLSDFMTSYQGGGAAGASKGSTAKGKGGGYAAASGWGGGKVGGPPAAAGWGGCKGGGAAAGWGPPAHAAASWGGGYGGEVGGYGGGWGGGKGGYGPVGSGASGGAGLGEFVKSGQRCSIHWKNAWQTYCTLYGNGMNDPLKYDDSHITGFVDYIGQLAFADLQAVAEEQGVPLDAQSGGKRPAPAAFATLEPPAKRPALGPRGGGAGVWGGAAGGNAGSDSGKTELVDKIKALQRSDPAAKEAWWAYCDQSYNGVKDPNRHEAESLEAFMATYGQG